MSIWDGVSKDIKVDSNYGDIELLNKDIRTTTNTRDICKDTVIERYKTNINDFALNPNYGADLEKNIGKGIDRNLSNSLVASLRYSLTYDNFIDANNLSIIPLIIGNEIKLYTYIKVGTTTLEITSSYDGNGVLKID